MEIIKVKITGTRPLLMNSDALLDPFNEQTKALKQITNKKKKTDDDYEAIAKASWRGSFYFDKDLGPYIPGVNVEAAMIAGGKLRRLGAQLKRSVEVIDDRCRLEYEGPRTIQQLWDKGFYDVRSVKVTQNRVMRYRPIFHKWWLTTEIAFDEETIDQNEVMKCLEDGGQYCGIGDYRPKFGRFSVEVIK